MTDHVCGSTGGVPPSICPKCAYTTEAVSEQITTEWLEQKWDELNEMMTGTVREIEGHPLTLNYVYYLFIRDPDKKHTNPLQPILGVTLREDDELPFGWLRLIRHNAPSRLFKAHPWAENLIEHWRENGGDMSEIHPQRRRGKRGTE